MPFPEKYTQKKHDCFRCCLAFYLDMHPSRVKYFDPYKMTEDGTDANMWSEYREWIRDKTGLELLIFDALEAINTFMDHKHKNWIAVVPPLDKKHNDNHAVVMKGDKLIYDPNGDYGRKRKPRKIDYAIVLADDYKECDDGSITFNY